MKKTLVLAALAAFGVSELSAQTYVTAPDGYLTKSGGNYAQLMGMYYREGNRSQLGDPTIKKGSNLPLRGIAWRPSSTITYTTSSGMGRKFSKFSLSMGHTNCAKMTSVFSNNIIGKLTNVYSGAFSLPTITSGTPKTWPNGGAIAKFSTLFIYNGKDDLLQDYTTDGYQLANGYTGSPFRSYYVDGCNGVSAGWTFLGLSPYNSAVGTWLPKRPFTGTTRCADSGVSTTADAYCYSGASIYGDNYRTTSLRCKFRPYMYSYYTAKGKPVIAAVTVGGIDVGVPIGAKCNRLHVNMSFPLIISSTTAGTSSSAFKSHLPTAYATYNNAFAGAPLYTQAAWNDSSSGAFSLTLSGKITLVDKKKGIGCANECFIYRYARTVSGSKQWFPSSPTYGNGPIRSPIYQKVDRYLR